MGTHLVEELYQELVYRSLDFFISTNSPFMIRLKKTIELAEYLPDHAFSDQYLNIDFANWTLEIAFLKNNQLNCIVVYDDAEYPLAIDLIDILTIFIKPLGLVVVNKFFIQEPLKVQKIENKTTLSNKTPLNKLAEEELSKSMSGMRLLKLGEE